MMNRLDEVLTKIGEEFGELISESGRHYVEVDIGECANRYGYPDIAEKYAGAHAVVPLKGPLTGMKVRIDGRTFVKYGQFNSGIATPGYVARQSSHKYKAFIPQDSMVLNFA